MISPYKKKKKKKTKTKKYRSCLEIRSGGLVAWLSWGRSRGLGSRPCRVMKWSQELPEESIKKHTRSKRGRHRFNTSRSFLRVSFWHLFKIYHRLIFPFGIFLAIGCNFIRCKVNKTVFTSPGDEYYNCLLTKYKFSTSPDCFSDLTTPWFVMRRNETKKTKRKRKYTGNNLQTFSLWGQISFVKLIPIEKKSSGKLAFKLHEIHCIIMINT